MRERAPGAEKSAQRIAPNASALRSIMMSTARSRDRMDERERLRAQQKLEQLAQASTAAGRRS